MAKPDKIMFLEIFPSLQKQQQDLISMVSETRGFQLILIGHCASSDYKVLSCAKRINKIADSIRMLLNQNPENQWLIAANAEWEYRTQLPGGHDKLATIQLTVRVSQTQIMAYIFQICIFEKLPNHLEALFNDVGILFIGQSNAQDFCKIQHDFKCQFQDGALQHQDIAILTASRSILEDASASLEGIVLICLQEELSKQQWSTKWTHLSDAQCKYAALDVIKVIKVYEHLVAVPVLKEQLKTENIQDGQMVVVVPQWWNLATEAEVAWIVPIDTMQHTPANIY